MCIDGPCTFISTVCCTLFSEYKKNIRLFKIKLYASQIKISVYISEWDKARGNSLSKSLEYPHMEGVMNHSIDAVGSLR